jgi:PKD repeat protein
MCRKRLYAIFDANVTGGASRSPSASEQSHTNDAGGILSYAWDFDGDSVIDRPRRTVVRLHELRHYTVSLTVTTRRTRRTR